MVPVAVLVVGGVWGVKGRKNSSFLFKLMPDGFEQRTQSL